MSEPKQAMIDYSKAAVPSDYKCGKCDATDCKLWRESNTMSVDLCCCDCAAADEETDISDIDESGSRTNKHGAATYQIGNYVPAVPTSDSAGYYRYPTIPGEGVGWWQALPTRP